MVEGNGVGIDFGKLEGSSPAPWPDEAGAKLPHLDLQVDHLDEASESLGALGASQADFQAGAGHRTALLDPHGQPLCLRPGPLPVLMAPIVRELAERLVQDAEGWHTWLDSHHTDHPGVWLVLGKRGGRTTALTYAQALDEALCFGWIDGLIGRRGNRRYRQRFTPRRPGSAWSARNVEHVARPTEAGRMQPT